MNSSNFYKASFIIPVHNEEKNIPLVYEAIVKIMESDIKKGNQLEIVFVNDGSQDNSEKEIEKLAMSDDRIKPINFSRNFGKEAATSAGLHNCVGDFAIIIDADLQHPVEIVPEFIKKWQEGNDVVLGKIEQAKSSLHKRISRKIFYKLMSVIQDGDIDLGGNDFRLVDRGVIDAFNELGEQNRATRNLIDWLGFKRTEILFTPNDRVHGEPSYTTRKLIRLAINAIVSNSLFPLKVAGYLGSFIFIISGIMGIFIFIVKYILKDPWGWGFSYPSILAVINMFLIGLVLMCLGLVAIYIGHIKHEVVGRPLYVIRKNRKAIR